MSFKLTTMQCAKTIAKFQAELYEAKEQIIDNIANVVTNKRTQYNCIVSFNNFELVKMAYLTDWLDDYGYTYKQIDKDTDTWLISWYDPSVWTHIINGET